MSELDANLSLAAHTDDAERKAWADKLAPKPHADKEAPADDWTISLPCALVAGAVVLAIVGISACLVAHLAIRIPF